MTRIHLKHRLYEGLAYGGAGEVQFGLKGGFLPGEYIGDDADPAVQALLANDPDVEIVRPDGPKQVFVATDGQEFSTKAALLHHHEILKAANDDAIARENVALAAANADLTRKVDAIHDSRPLRRAETTGVSDDAADAALETAAAPTEAEVAAAKDAKKVDAKPAKPRKLSGAAAKAAAAKKAKDAAAAETAKANA